MAVALNSTIHARHLSAGQRPGKTIALRIVVTGHGQELGVPFGLDAFGHELQLERMRHLRGRLDDHAIIGVVAHSHDKRLVELERVHRQVAQVAER